MNIKLKANNTKELEKLKNWFKGRFPKADNRELEKFLRVVSKEN